MSSSVEAGAIRRHPAWLKVRAPGSPGYLATREVVRRLRLHTVCEEAACPNIGECWSRKHATVMVLGAVCTRACGFCNVKTGRPGPVDPAEPARLAVAVAELGLRHVVVTSVDRDDLADGGAAHFVACIEAIRAAAPGTTIEVLTPDFRHKHGAIERVAGARPDVYNHNVETVPRLYRRVRPGASYAHSLRLLARVKGEEATWRKPSARAVSRSSANSAGGTKRSTGRCAGDGRRYCPIVTKSTPAARRSRSTARTSSGSSPRPSIRPDFVNVPASSAFTRARSRSECA